MAENIPSAPTSYSSLVQGITSLDFSDVTSGILNLTTEKAFPLVVTPDRKVLMAASHYGKGRVLVLPSKRCLTESSFFPFLHNAVTWLKASAGSLVGIPSTFSALAQFLSSKCHKVEVSDTITTSFGVYCKDADQDTQDSQTKELILFIKGGGGLLIAGQPDVSATDNTDFFTSYPGNKVTGVAGIHFSKGTSPLGVYTFSEKMPAPLMTFDYPSLSLHVSALLRDVECFELGTSSTASSLLLHGSNAFPLGQTDGFYTFAAGALYGKGRVVVLGHEAYLNFPNLQSFIRNVLKWLDNGRNGVVGVHSGISAFNKYISELNIPGIISNVTSMDPSLSVFCCNSYVEQDTAKILQFVAEGGGLLVGGHAWYWSYANSHKNLMTDYNGNKLLNATGISILNNSITPGTCNAVNSENLASYYHFRQFMWHLQSIAGNEDTLTNTQASWFTIMHQNFKGFLKMKTENNCPCACVYASLAELFQDSRMPNPTSTMPIAKGSKESYFLYMKAILYEHYSTTPDNLKPAGVERFPAIPGSPEQNILINGDNEADGNVWISTRLYLPPRATATFTFPIAVASCGLQVQIGCQSDNLLKRNEFKRAPVVILRCNIKTETITVSSLFGGLVYIILPKKAKLGQFNVSIQGVQPAPFFQKGETSISEWQKTIRHYPAPWAELAADNLILTVPSVYVSSLEDPEKVLRFWDLVMDQVKELGGFDSFLYPERIVADVQISLGFMHSGYPIMIHDTSVPGLLDVDVINRSGSWGIFHEMGHNQQKLGWNFFPNTDETTNNLWSVYIMENLCNIPRSKAHGQLKPDTREARIKTYIKNGAKLEEWEVWTALETYLQLQEAFGWDPLRQLFRNYQRRTDAGKDNTYKMNLWCELYSENVQKNLAPFFKTWGWPITKEVSEKLATLSEWKENPMNKYKAE
ncbi:TRPM8 channel-associated factor homolog [Discoglossus pictus]